MDSDGILRVGGRLELSNLPYDAKHPVILPKKHHISKFVIAHIHNLGRHNLGVNFTLAELRQKYWIVNGREEIKRWKREGYVCKLGRRRRGEQIMAPLLDFLKVLSNTSSLPVGFAVGKDFSYLQRAKFYRWIFPPVT